jgi:hypothetical protein
LECLGAPALYYTCQNCSKEKRRSHWDRRFETFDLPEQGFYEDLYLTEHPYGLVSGVATDLPDND